MIRLANKHILLGVTGGIAAYKSAELARRLRDEGATVRVVMTAGATRFITPLTMQAVSANRVHLHLLDAEAEAGMGHIELARWADLLLIAPASANFLARLAHGAADDLLSAVALATAAPLAVAPAMNRQMWDHPATQDNLSLLKNRGVQVFGPGQGDQACGEVGWGRMLEPEEIIASAAGMFATGHLQGLKVVITAGPTWEALDPVRGLSNRSSGKMGYAVATAAAAAGARVILVSGPSSLTPPERVQLVRVESAEQMSNAVHAHIEGAHIFIAAAAVADYRPVKPAEQKIKKHSERLALELVKTPDILKGVAALRPAPFTVGFAAETDDLEKHGRAKLLEKGLDLVAANRVGVQDSGIGADDNALLLIDRQGVTELPLQRKAQLARLLIEHIARRYHAEDQTQDSRSAHR